MVIEKSSTLPSNLNFGKRFNQSRYTSSLMHPESLITTMLLGGSYFIINMDVIQA
jgi:hypothetical protein